MGAVRLTGGLLGTAGFLAGIGMMRGLLQPHDLFGATRAYNVWVFLAAVLGAQWLLLLGGLLGYVVVRRETGALTLLQRGAVWLVQRISGLADRAVWKGLLEGGAGYRSVLSWRLARLTQGVAVAFNLGLLAGFFGCLFFLSVRFYWESTLEGSGWGLLSFIEAMALPWSWSGLGPPPVESDIDYSVLEKFFYEKAGVEKMWPFLMVSVVVYGLLPRLGVWVLCLHRERRALATLAFQAPRHRDLWRRLTKVERTVASPGQADGVVRIDVGGTNVRTDAVREFLLRELRVNPSSRHAAAVLDEDREKEALETIRAADLGVVLLVEGWALSPKQMRALYGRVRAVGGEDLAINFLVLGELRDGQPTAPHAEEWREWVAFVDSLQDPAVEAVAYETPARVEEEA